MRKRILSLVLVVAFAMSLFVVGASATSFKDDNDVMNKAAVDKMVSLNIINGRDTGNFDPKGIVTRAEMTKMICVAMSGGVDPKYSTNNATFTDTKNHWGAGYIEYGVSQGIVAGMGNKIFAPDQGVTGTQAAKMLLVALGYDATYEQFTGPSWAMSTLKVARQKGLFDDLGSIDANAPLSRDNAAQMVFNFCNANMVKYTFGISGSGSNLSGVKQAEDIIISNNSGTNKYETILTKYYKLIDATEGYMNGWSYDKDKKEYKYSIAEHVSNNTYTQDMGQSKDCKYKTTQDFTGLYGQKVKLLFKDKNNNGKYDVNDDTIYDIAAKDSKVVASGCVGDWDTIKPGDTDFTMNGTTYKLTGKASEVNVFAFGNGKVAGTLDTYQSNTVNNLTEPFNFQLIDTTGDGEGDALIVHPIIVKKITYVDTKSVTTDTDTYKFDNCDIYKDVAKNDWAIITDSDYSKTGRDTLEKITLVQGKIDAIKKVNEKIVVGGKTYVNAAGALGDTNYKLGSTVELTLVNGYIYNAKKLTAGVNKESVVMVIQAKAPGTGIDAGTQDVSAVFSDGVKKTITVKQINDKEVKDDALDNNKDNYFKSSVTPVPAFAGGNFDADYTLYSYSKDGDQYKLTPYNAPGAVFNDSTAAKDYDKGYNTTDLATKFKDGKLTIAGNGDTIRLDDDAVVFYFYDTDNKGIEYKVTTGAVAAKWAELQAGQILKATAYTNEKDGFQNAQLAIFKLAKNVAPSDDTTLYGYIVEDPQLRQVGNDYYYWIKVWNGTESTGYFAKGTDSHKSISSSTTEFNSDANIKKGTPISFSAAGDITDGKAVDSVKALTGTANAITAYTDGKNYVQLQNAETKSGMKDLKITSDTKVIRFNSDKVESATGNGITIAKEINVGGGLYYNNCYVEAKSDGDLKVLIIDSESKLATSAISVTSAQADTNAELQNLFNASKTITVSDTTYTLNSNITIPTGMTLNVTNIALNGYTVTKEGTGALNVGGDCVLANTVDAAAVNAALTNFTKVTISGNYTVANNVTVPNTKTLTVTGTLTVKASYTLDVDGTLAVTGAISNIENNGTIDFAAAPTADIMGKLEAITTAGAKVIFGAGATSVANTIWYTAKGAADTNPAAGTNTGSAATAVAANAAIAAGTYVYGTLGFDGNDNTTTATLAGWFK